MLYISKITSDAQQKLLLTGIPGLQITMTLRFMPRVQQWIMGISYGDFSAQGIPLVVSLNLLQQFQNNIPFGISCVRADGLDPFTQDDFANKIANLYLLDSTDLAEINAGWFA